MNKITVLAVLLLAMLWSCKKNTGTTNDTAVLESHFWYPYQTEVVIFDTMTVTGRGVSNPQAVTTIQKLDTVIIMEFCVAQSKFELQRGGNLNITNLCSGIEYDSSWSLMHNTVLSMASLTSVEVKRYYSAHLPSAFTYPVSDTTHSLYSSQGSITEIDNAHFIFNDAVINIGADFTTVSADTNYRISAKEYTTYLAH